MEKLEGSYKGFIIKLFPREEICSEYGAHVLDDSNHMVLTSNRAGKTVARAMEHAQRLIDFEIEYAKE